MPMAFAGAYKSLFVTVCILTNANVKLQSETILEHVGPSARNRRPEKGSPLHHIRKNAQETNWKLISAISAFFPPATQNDI
ncbi:hypothetical protein HYPSUDRAFT_41444 [Hypholoma sublateritium FD-334 SS-4]|uniref:Uncharacterized protein n=1 Tax=Hypholoma sublateritium (strain FD-334 SS-4) TaxID=945553 RepID=A0A0D2PQ69_HYPSF|nr:hypothetical protein HYPSUDRAFT_41444 [Hypholoma sublateritium FD-334 SS-4]